jgi:hypothetical protein
MPEQREGQREIAPAAAVGKAPERFTRRIDCAASAADRVRRESGRGTGRLREPGAGLPDSER